MGRKRQSNKKGNNKKTSNRDSSESEEKNETELAFPIGARVELRKENYRGSTSTSLYTGTVAAHWRKQKNDGRIAPYLMLMDDGVAVYAHREEALMHTDVPAFEVKFNVGCRVECQLAENEEITEDTKWFPGTIIQAHKDWARSPLTSPPYFIRFDYGRERPFWGPAERIREIQGKDKGTLSTLRFEVGDRVKCYVDSAWQPGKIVQTWYREDSFKTGYRAPYQVVLDCGRFIYSPMDDDDCVMKSTLPCPELRFSVGDRVKCRVERGWEPGIVASTDVMNGQRLYPYGIKQDYNGECVYAPCDNDMFIRKIRRFKKGDRVECHTEEDGWVLGEVAEVDVEDETNTCRQIVDILYSYKVRLDNDDELYVDEDEDTCIRQSTAPHVVRGGEKNGFVHVVSRMLINNEEYGEASEMLREKVEEMRIKIKHNPSHVDVASWRVDLAYFLSYLAEVHQIRGRLDEMKLALVEAAVLTKLSNDKSKSQRLLDITSKLATQAALSGDNRNALKYSEEAILLVKETTHGQDSFRLGSLLFETGKLNIMCDMREKGLAQMSDGITVLDRLCGSDSKQVVQAKEEYDRIVGESEGADEDEGEDETGETDDKSCKEHLTSK